MLKIKPEISIITFIEIQSKKDVPDREMLKYRAFAKSSTVYSEINEDIAEQTSVFVKNTG